MAIMDSLRKVRSISLFDTIVNIKTFLITVEQPLFRKVYFHQNICQMTVKDEIL